MSGTLVIKNRQRTIALNARLFRMMTKSLLTDLLELDDFDFGISVVQAPEMAQINKTYLQHEGSTDVITFDYDDPSKASRKYIYGEIFICIDDAMAQARQFCTSWQSELARYVIHGVLHLLGYDDIRTADRRKMKREENRLLKELARLFPLRKLGRDSRLAP